MRARTAPVLAFIHGGAGVAGSGSVRLYDGTAFARDGIVLVTLNYRLGALSSFAHPSLTAEAPPEQPLGAFGLLDQVAAPRWVRDNIEGSGGDPNAVTILGQSSGGRAIPSGA